jgi:large subunit ribosomal protein L18
MMTKKDMRVHRRYRIRSKVAGTAERPRLSVFRSNKFLSVQFIDDEKGITICALRMAGATTAKAKELGIKAAEMAKHKGIKVCVFDRSGYRYHGIIQVIAETVREGGVQI